MSSPSQWHEDGGHWCSTVAMDGSNSGGSCSMVMAMENGKVVVSRSKEVKQQREVQQPTNNQQGMTKVVRGRQAAVEAKRRSSGG